MMLPASSTAAAAAVLPVVLLSVGGVLAQLPSGDGQVDKMNAISHQLHGKDTFKKSKTYGKATSCTEPVEKYGQCGGMNYVGSTCCVDGYGCESAGEYFSQCRPEEDGTSNGSMVTESDDEDKSTSEEPDKTCQDAVAAYGQCGGDDYNGSTCCLDGYECQQMAVCYSECRPEETQSQTPSPQQTEQPQQTQQPQQTPSPQQTQQPQQTPSPQGTQQPQETPSPQETEPPAQTEPPQQPGTFFYRPGPARKEDAAAHIAGLEAAGRPVDAAKVDAMTWEPQAVWFTGPSGDPHSGVQYHMGVAAAAGEMPVFALYYLPFRDCSQYSDGGATSMEEYDSFIGAVASAIGTGDAYIILEPDGLAIIPFSTKIDGTLDWCQPVEADAATAEDERYTMTVNAVTTLKANPGTKVYLDGSHADWHHVNEMSYRLLRANIQDADGFFINLSNYVRTERLIAYGEMIAKCVFWGYQGNDVALCTDDDDFYVENVDPLIEELGDDDLPHFVVDTSRNGNGVWTADQNYPDPMEWCNPPTATLGETPTLDTASAYADAYLWVKIPGESDGECDRGLTDQGGVDPEWGMVDPGAGSWFPEQVEVLIEATGA